MENNTYSAEQTAIITGLKNAVKSSKADLQKYQQELRDAEKTAAMQKKLYRYEQEIACIKNMVAICQDDYDKCVEALNTYLSSIEEQKHPKTVYMVKFLWILEDSEDCDITLYENYEDALDAFLDTVAEEVTNEDMSWVKSAIDDGNVEINAMIPEALDPDSSEYNPDSDSWKSARQRVIANREAMYYNIVNTWSNQADYISLEEIEIH